MSIADEPDKDHILYESPEEAVAGIKSMLPLDAHAERPADAPSRTLDNRRGVRWDIRRQKWVEDKHGEDLVPRGTPHRAEDGSAPYDKVKEVASPAPYDAVQNPEHYAKHAIQPIQFIMSNNLGFCEANVVKYVTRWKSKDGIRDLKKAREYLNILIEDEERKA